MSMDMDTSSGAEMDDGSSSSGSAMSMGSDGPDYSYERQLDFEDESETWATWDEEPNIIAANAGDIICSGGEEVPLFALADECSFTGNWKPFLDRLESHPHEVHGRIGWNDRPTALHAIIAVMDCEERIPPSVVKAVLDVLPCAARIAPLPLHEACRKIGRGEGCLEADCFRMIVDAHPDAVKARIPCRPFFLTKNIPLHQLCDLPASEDLTEEVARACAEAAQVLLGAYPEGALVQGARGWIPLNRVCKKIIRRDHNEGPSEQEDESGSLWCVYMAVLRGTCKALYSKHDAPMEEVDSLLLHTAVRLGQRNEALARLMETMPHLGKCRDGEECYPLSYVTLKSCVSDENFRTLVGLNPDAAGSPNQDGKLPLHHAVSRDFDTVQCILDAAPQALKARDEETRLYPFMMAAVGPNRVNQIDVVFELLRKNPTLASSGMAQDAEMVKMETKMHQIEQERDEWKARSESLAKENEELRSRLTAHESHESQGSSSRFLWGLHGRSG